MILSYRHRFVFVKTKKTGGTSVEIALSPLCGDEDVVTPISPIDEYRRKRDGGTTCRNFAVDAETEQRFLACVEEHSGHLADFPESLQQACVFTNHMPLADVMRRAREEAAHFYKFTIERHPYEKAISLVHFFLRFHEYGRGESCAVDLDEITGRLDEFIDRGHLAHIRNYDLYSLNGRLAVDEVIDHARLTPGLDAVLRRLGLRGEAEPVLALPRAKMGVRDRSVKASDLLSDAQKTYIQDLCREEFELMGYEE